MKLARYEIGGVVRVGVVVGEEVVELPATPGDAPRSVEDLLQGGAETLAAVAAVAAAPGAVRHRLADVTLRSPVARPGKFLAIGLNYADHIEESPFDTPEHPIVFNKQATCVNGPFGDVVRPAVSTQLDYEGELGFVIGRRCRHVPRERAHEVIGGFVIINDVSVRDWQLRTPTMTMGKSFDTHGPMGPWLITPDELGDPHVLPLRTYVNGELRQESNTRELVFDCYDQVAHLSTAFTLEPGDVVATGTCGGVGIALGRFLNAGDVVRVEIDGIGAIENTVVEEGEPTCWIEDEGGVTEAAA